MLKHYASLFRKFMIVTDWAIISAAFFLAYFLRNHVESLYPIDRYLWVLPVIILFWGGFLQFFRMYASFRVKSLLEVMGILAQASIAAFLVVSSLIYLLKSAYISRSLILLIFILATLVMALEKIVLVIFFRYIRQKGFNFRNLIIVGTGRRAQALINKIKKHPEFGLHIIGLLDVDPARVEEEVNGCKVIGTLDDLPNILMDGGDAVDHVIFIVPRSWIAKIERPVIFCETMGITVSLGLDIFNHSIAKAKQSDLHGFPLLTFEPVSDKLLQIVAKRLIDIVLSAVGLIVLSPVFLATAVAIKMTSPGPVFFFQERCSLQGRRFKLVKFRTMVEGAEAKLEKLLAQNEMQGPIFKMKNDPRLTKIGKFLRKFSIDELPQLWNVLKGEMSLVGPRPPLPKEVKEYDPWHRRRLSMRPGITCLWQISGRNNIQDFGKWVQLDLEYIDKWSLVLDFQILLRTVPVVLLGIGAK